MRICVDGVGISHMYGTGLYSYTYELLNSLFQNNPDSYYDILWDDSLLIEKWQENKTLSYLSLNLNRIKNEYSNLQEHILHNKVDIYHSPNNGFSLPLNKYCKYVITVHDLLPLNNKHYVDKKYLNKFNEVFPSATQNADKIIAVSNFVKDELICNFDVLKEKIEVIYPIVSSQFKKKDSIYSRNILKNKYKIEGDFLLYAGSIHPRKNLSQLVQVFKEILEYKTDIKLVIAGKIDGKREAHYLDIKYLAQKLGIESYIIFTGTVEYNDMPYLYSMAKCAINLSDYEGFPMSSVEAMRCEVPLICSISSSFKEVLGNGALFIDDIKDKNQIKEVILDVLYNDNYREYIIKKGNNCSANYSDYGAIKKMIEVYQSLV
jgi:glycosyltransferase involved in cell wall biosynthesis